MLVTLTNPIGIDWYIQKLQQYVHDQLLVKWDILTATYTSYPRCYRNKTEDGYIAENYIGAGNYKEVYWDSALKASSFFGLTGNISRKQGTASADVHLVFFADLKKLKPAIAHRADEETRQDVISMFGLAVHGFTFLGVDLGVENVLREYSGSRRDNRLKYLDMHPVHTFRLNFKLNYDPNKIC